jgi:hypothetical protein
MLLNLQRALLVACGLWLLLAPAWMDGYPSTVGPAALNSYALGLLVSLGGLLALRSKSRLVRLAPFGFAIWLVVFPFVTGLISTAPGAAWNGMLTGLVVGVLGVTLL